MSGELEKLAAGRDQILLAEVAGLVHNLGKLNANFLQSTVNDQSHAVELPKKHGQFVNGYAPKRFAKPSPDLLAPRVRDILASHEKLDESNLPTYRSAQGSLEESQHRAARVFNKFYRGVGPWSDDQAAACAHLELEVVGERWRLTDLLTLFWDEFFHKPENNDYQRTYALDRWLANPPHRLPHWLIHAHGEMSGSEKYQIMEDEDFGITKTRKVKQEKTSFEDLRIATAFGYERELPIWQLRAKQQRIINRVPHLSLSKARWRALFQASLRHGLGDTQRPINEITLWDYASSIAALFKTAVAKSFLEDRAVDANGMHWRLLGIRFDGLDYICQAARIGDLLGRQERFQAALERVCIALSQEIPIASQVYQDENGTFFVVPDSPNLKLKDIQAIVEEQLKKTGLDDVRPRVDWSEEPLRGKQLNLGQELERQDKAARPSIDPKTVQTWWQGHVAEVCQVCGLRPVISVEEGYCSSCKAMRQERVKKWLVDARSTIWLDEVADSHGRLALMVCCFPLESWLRGTLVESLALGLEETIERPVPKFPSFPRVQRIWSTTQTFWEETQACFKKFLSDSRRRLIITLSENPHLEPGKTYKLDLLGNARMSVIEEGAHLVSIDNPAYIAKQLPIPSLRLQNPAEAALEVGLWLKRHSQSEQGTTPAFRLYPDDEQGKQFDIHIQDIDYQDVAYATFIPLLAEPRTFMALVPADKALDIAGAIKTKYEIEMGKVRDRLPLHLGLVFFPRKQPLRAVLEAGRAMLDGFARLTPEEQEPWKVAEVREFPDHLPEQLKSDPHFRKGRTLELTRDGRRFRWHVPLAMGDGQTCDLWYPYVFVAADEAELQDRKRRFKGCRPTGQDGKTEPCWLVHAGELQTGDGVYVTPSRFDFAFLDTTARRFELSYEHGRRREPARRCRPYLLDDLERFAALWQTLSKLSTAQIKRLDELIEAKRQAWEQPTGHADHCEAFERFVHDALANADWPQGQRPKSEQRDQLHRAALTGELHDVIELYMEILKRRPEQERRGPALERR